MSDEARQQESGAAHGAAFETWRVDGGNAHLVRDVKDGKMVAMAATPEMARLIAEAPALLRLLRAEFLAENAGQPCSCRLCQEGRAIVARVEGGNV